MGVRHGLPGSLAHSTLCEAGNARGSRTTRRGTLVDHSTLNKKEEVKAANREGR